MSAEWVKLTTVRLPWRVASAAVVLTTLLAMRTVLQAGAHGAPSLGTAPAVLAVLGATSWGPYFALVLGVTIVTEEFHHGTITGTLLQSPRRWALFRAKVATGVIGGVALGAATLLAAVWVGVLGRAVTPDVLDADMVRRSLGLVLLHPAYAVIGVGVGALLHRVQALAVLLPLLWLAFVEDLLVGTIDRGWLPWTLKGVSAATANAGDVAGVQPMWAGAVLLGGACLVLALAGGSRLERTDLT